MSWSIVIVFVQLLTCIKGYTICNESCQVKTYSLSTNYTTKCTNNCLIQAYISVIEQEHFDEYLNFTLIGYNISEFESSVIGLKLNKSNSNVIYSCSKQKSGLTSAFVAQATKSYTIGSSIYLNGKLYCSWIMSKQDVSWPLVDDGSKANLVTDNGYQIWLQSGQKFIPVGEHSSELPIYQMKFIKCCGYRIRGNHEYLLAIKSNPTSTDFLMQVIGRTPKTVRIALNNSDQLGIVAECDYASGQLNGYATIGTVSSSITSQLDRPKIFDYRCSWSLPAIVDSLYGILETKRTIYTLQITRDNVVVYNETNVVLKNFAPPIVSSFVMLISSVSLALARQIV
uniref:Farnesoic acid O-methyl transferase domain-containing protein n=1 Tax=Tetranychus urticae TaxID=32264 RepID=T1KH04_TETUR